MSSMIKSISHTHSRLTYVDGISHIVLRYINQSGLTTFLGFVFQKVRDQCVLKLQ